MFKDMDDNWPTLWDRVCAPLGRLRPKAGEYPLSASSILMKD